MVFDLQSSGLDLCMTEEVIDQLGLEVGDADGAGEFGGDKGFHCAPGFLDGRFGGADFVFAISEPADLSQLSSL